jgi:hypothetical protein
MPATQVLLNVALGGAFPIGIAGAATPTATTDRALRSPAIENNHGDATNADRVGLPLAVDAHLRASRHVASLI